MNNVNFTKVVQNPINKRDLSCNINFNINSLNKTNIKFASGNKFDVLNLKTSEDSLLNHKRKRDEDITNYSSILNNKNFKRNQLFNSSQDLNKLSSIKLSQMSHIEFKNSKNNNYIIPVLPHCLTKKSNFLS